MNGRPIGITGLSAAAMMLAAHISDYSGVARSMPEKALLAEVPYYSHRSHSGRHAAHKGQSAKTVAKSRRARAARKVQQKRQRNGS